MIILEYVCVCVCVYACVCVCVCVCSVFGSRATQKDDRDLSSLS